MPPSSRRCSRLSKKKALVQMVTVKIDLILKRSCCDVLFKVGISTLGSLYFRLVSFEIQPDGPSRLKSLKNFCSLFMWKGGGSWWSFFCFLQRLNHLYCWLRLFHNLQYNCSRKGVSKRCEVTSVSIKDSSSTSKCCSCRRCCNLTWSKWVHHIIIPKLSLYIT